MAKVLKSNVPINSQKLLEEYDHLVFVSDEYGAFNAESYKNDLLQKHPNLAKKLIDEKDLGKKHEVTNFNEEEEFYRYFNEDFRDAASFFYINGNDKKSHTAALIAEKIGPKNIYDYLYSLSSVLKTGFYRRYPNYGNIRNINHADRISLLLKYFNKPNDHNILRTVSNVFLYTALLLVAPAFVLSTLDLPKIYIKALWWTILGLIVFGLVIDISIRYKSPQIKKDPEIAANRQAPDNGYFSDLNLEGGQRS